MIVRAGILYDGTLAKARTNVHLHINDHRISAITAAEGDFDLETACATPGLVNAHVHLEMSGEPDTMSFFLESTVTQRMLYAVANAQATVRSGVTTVRDVGCSQAIAMELRDAVDAGRIEGPTVRAAGNVLCMTGGHGWFIGRAVDGPWDAVKGVREQRRKGADCIKLIATGGVLSKGAVPGQSQLTQEEMFAAISEARRNNMPVTAHAIGTEGIKNALRAGVTSIEHGHLLDDEAIELFKSKGAYLVPTLAAPVCIVEHAREDMQPEFVKRKALELREQMVVNITRAYKAGVKIAGGSDAGTPHNYHDKYAYEVELMHTLLGMTPQEALHSATAIASQLIGAGSGTLLTGELADVLLLDSDIADSVGTLASPTTVIKNGRTAFQRTS
ncbi:MAG: amidohydrolase family protein [Candidatus Eremiobacteraeota bacterium]|nr:amidohydrolase family protein [Candidatus Eremiobacteraeota bacterium]